MRATFDPDSGRRTDLSVGPGERVGRMELLAGTIGSYKNPRSCRDANLDDPTESDELIMLANHLVRIMGARRKPIDAAAR